MSSGADRRRFEQLARETHGELLKYALRRSANAEDAADVVSETYLIAWRRLEAVPRGASARFWLFAVARNVVLRGAEHQRASHALIERLQQKHTEQADQIQVEVAGSDDRLVRALRAGLASLPPDEYELVTLSVWEGLTPKEIARVTGLSANVVRVRLHRTRRRLLQRLEQTRTRSAARTTTGERVEARSWSS